MASSAQFFYCGTIFFCFFETVFFLFFGIFLSKFFQVESSVDALCQVALLYNAHEEYESAEKSIQKAYLACGQAGWARDRYIFII